MTFTERRGGLATMQKGLSMDAHTVIHLIPEDVDAMAKTGRKVLRIDSLVQYLGRLEQTDLAGGERLDAFALEQFKAANTLHVANYRMTGEVSLEMFRSVLDSAQAALRASMTINGAAATALLAFMGHLLTVAQPRPAVSEFAQPMAFFVGGVLIAAVGFGLGYVTQRLYADGYEKSGHVANGVCVATIITSYFGFGFATWQLFNTFAAIR